MENNIIVVKQLPVIEEQLKAVKEQIILRVSQAMEMEVNEDTYKAVKKFRAELNKEKAEYENRRKEVKRMVLEPYEQFEKVYKDCILDIFKVADEDLNGKITAVEDKLKETIKNEIVSYFYEYAQSCSIPDYIKFNDANINVSLSVSKKKLKEQCKSFVDKITDDLALIDTQEHKAEILVEYKQSLNVSNAITSVKERYQAIAEEEARIANEQETLYQQSSMEDIIDSVIDEEEEIQIPIVTEIVNQSNETESETEITQSSDETGEVYETSFTVRGTLTQLKALKKFLKEGNYDYE